MADVIARRHDDAFNSHDADARAAIEGPDVDFILPGGITLRGHEHVMPVVRAFWEALPDGRITADDRFAAGEAVVTEGSLAGTHSGTFRTPERELPPTGTLRYASVKRFEEGRLVSEHLYFDQLEFLEQLGAMS